MKLSGQIGIFIHVQLTDLGGCRDFAGDFFDDRKKSLAGATPVSYTHLDVYKRQEPSAVRQAESKVVTRELRPYMEGLSLFLEIFKEEI